MTLWLYLRAIKATIQLEDISTCIEGASTLSFSPTPSQSLSFSPWNIKAIFNLIYSLCLVRRFVCQSGLNFNSALLVFGLCNMLNTSWLRLGISTFLMLACLMWKCRSVCACVSLLSCCCCLSCFLCWLKLLKLVKICNSNAESVKVPPGWHDMCVRVPLLA